MAIGLYPIFVAEGFAAGLEYAIFDHVIGLVFASGEGNGAWPAFDAKGGDNSGAARAVAIGVIDFALISEGAVLGVGDDAVQWILAAVAGGDKIVFAMFGGCQHFFLADGFYNSTSFGDYGNPIGAYPAALLVFTLLIDIAEHDEGLGLLAATNVEAGIGEFCDALGAESCAFGLGAVDCVLHGIKYILVG